MAKFVPQPELPVSEQAQIRRDKLAALQAEGRDPFVQTKFDFNADSAAIKADYEAYEGKIVRVAGRLMSKRGQGKVMFCDLQDNTGRIQLFVKIDEMGEEEYNRFKKNDIGDIVGVEGEVFKTKTEEISIRTRSITLLSSWIEVVRIEISPVLVLKTAPSTPRISPMSFFLNRAYSSSPISSIFTKSWMRPVESCRSQNMTLPWPRLDIRRPATRTVFSSKAS